MKLHIITVGRPKFAYAQSGFELYCARIAQRHQLRVTHIADKSAGDSTKILATAGQSYKVALVIADGASPDSHQLAKFLEDRELAATETCFIIGGPDGLPGEVIAACDFRWSLSPLTFPHDLAMLIVAEALYRALSIKNNLPYHH